MSEFTKDYDAAGKRQAEREREFNRLFDQRMREPMSLPEEFKTWSKSYIEGSNLQVPVSQIIGLATLDHFSAEGNPSQTLTTTLAEISGATYTITKTGTYLHVCLVNVLDGGTGWGSATAIIHIAGGAISDINTNRSQSESSGTFVGAWVKDISSVPAAGSTLTLQARKTVAGGTVSVDFFSLSSIRLGGITVA